jgi:hypothetical protein
VVEVIETARDNLELGRQAKEAGIVDSDDDDSGRDRRPGSLDSDSDSNSSSSDTEDDDEGQISSVPDGSAAQKQGPIDKVRDYRRRDKRLHRQHRGLMQWKVSSRTLV